MFELILLLLQIMLCYCNTLHSKGEKELVFSDVLKNITIANKILQDLINNYERLDKIYQSQELLQMHSTSSETEQTFKSLTVNKPKKKQQERSNKKYTSKPFIGTAMIYESLSSEKVGKESDEEIEEVKNNKRPVKPKFNNFKGIKISNEVLNTRFNILNSKSQNKKSAPNSSDRESEAESQESTESKESEEVEQIIIDIPNEVNAVVVNTPNENIIKSDSGDKPITNIWGTKTRFSIQHTANRKEHTNLPRDDTEMSRDALRSRKNKSIAKMIQSTIISTNKIKKNTSIYKPVRFRTHTSEISQRKNNPKIKNKEKITLLIITNNKKANYDWNKRSKETKVKNKKVFPNTDSHNDLLRSEYGETCLQMPIKKCNKALKNVNKNICRRRFKCKSDFKSDFIQNSKDGCNEEFAYRENHADKPVENETNSEKYEKFSPPEFRELKKKTLKNDGREKENSVKALPKKKLDHFIPLRNETLRLKRDKYEKKCQKESLKKCNNACSYALKETCSTHTCEKRKKKAIESECKTQCKIAFKDTKKRVQSSSESDSESDSESNSDSESDSDNESESDIESDSDQPNVY